MATNVNPTRMELTRLKRRLATAVRGHKLLKDKRDEMVRQFMIYIRRNHELRLKMEKALQNVSHHFVVARAHMGFLTMNEALLYPARSAEFEVGSKNVMSVDVPTLTTIRILVAPCLRIQNFLDIIHCRHCFCTCFLFDAR